MKYICLVYNEEETLGALTDDELAAHICECRGWVAELDATGRHVFSSALLSPREAATVRVRNGNVLVTDGPFAETKEYLGGFTIFEAHDLNQAIAWAARLDAARVGCVEVRPVVDVDADATDPLDRRILSALRRCVQDEK